MAAHSHRSTPGWVNTAGMCQSGSLVRERGFALTNSPMKGLVLWGGPGMWLSWAGPAAPCYMMGWLV